MNLSEEMWMAFADPRVGLTMFALSLAGIIAFLFTLWAYEREKKEWRREKESLLRELRGKGFTLVEMLVVLAIIAVLSAILLPSISALQRYTHQTTCISNMQKIYHALRMYYYDFDGTYPDALYPQLKAYKLTEKDFHCPADVDHDNPADPMYLTYVVPDPVLSPYFSTLSSYYADLPDWQTYIPTWGVPYARIRAPLSVPSDQRANFLGELIKKQLYAKEPFNTTVITWCGHHDGRYVVLFLDGHTEVRNEMEMLKVLEDGYPASWRIEPRR
jgi:prepilin-type N-terminal cleavage/methylation domain-containing protein/prepilin-type processing-associated H-X9-DG protein